MNQRQKNSGLHCYRCDAECSPDSRRCYRCGCVAFYRSWGNPEPYEGPEPAEPAAEAPMHARHRGGIGIPGGRRPRRVQH